MQKKEKKRIDEDEIIYRLLLVLVVIGVLYLIPVVLFDKDIMYGVIRNVPCPIHALTGGYCPGCGGTRAVRFLLQGDVWNSFYYHPVVLYMAVGITVFMISHSLKHLTKGKIRGIHFHANFLYIGLGIILINMLIKNYYYFELGISLIE